jgi:crossover junction endodeoxyribonuclease RusA
VQRPDLILPERDDPPHYYRLVIPATAPWLTANDRQSWTAKYRTVRRWRHDTALYCTAANIPRMTGAYIIAELRLTTAGRRDPGNWYPTAKAAIDGLVDAKVLPDDDAAHVVGPDMREGKKSPTKQLILHLWPYALAVPETLPKRRRK